MYTQTQLEAIKLFGRKDLSFGLLFKYEKWWDDEILTFCSIYDDTGNTKTISYLPFDYEMTWEDEYSKDMDIEILWHVPHLEDLFRVAEEKGIDFWMEFWYTLRVSPKDWTYHEIKYNPTLPLIDQPSLPEIINLFK